MTDAASAKDEGNEKFKAKDYNGAILAYSKSLEFDATQHLCYSNRCAAFLKLAEAEPSAESEHRAKALADAERCVELMPSWGKGYRRVADAYQAMKRFPEALSMLENGEKVCAEEDFDWGKQIKEVLKWQFVDSLKGTWHGTVNEVLGGYDQEMEFVNNDSVRVEVLGRSILGKFWVDIQQEPHHLNIQVPPMDMPPGMPPPPPVPYIARIDDTGLHLCCPYLKMERPTEFTGQGYVLMKKGGLTKQDNNEIANLSRKEKYQRCVKEVLEILPTRKMEEPSQTDTEEQASQKLMTQVRFESQMFKVCQGFGEDFVKEVLRAADDGASIPEELKDLEDFTKLKERLRICGMVDDRPSAPPPPVDKPAAVTGPSTVEEPRKKTEKADRQQEAVDRQQEAADSGGCSPALVSGVVISMVAVASVAFMLSRKRS